MRAFNHAQREKFEADWSFTIFVVNSQAEGEGTFAPGSFSRAFAFAGGLFMVVPSTRPASTFAHETGHMFWAAMSTPTAPASTRFAAITTLKIPMPSMAIPIRILCKLTAFMSAGTSLTNAYAQVVSPASTLAMLGWKDSDGDGIFDVMDVPLSLDGVGRVDVASGTYRFAGSAKVQTLPNLNSSGLGNDITLNRISRIEAKIGSGDWQVVRRQMSTRPRSACRFLWRATLGDDSDSGS